MVEKYLCNHCFLAEAHDVHPNLDKTQCKGLSKEKAEKGEACSKWKYEIDYS